MADVDGDGVPDVRDNCVSVENSGQEEEKNIEAGIGANISVTAKSDLEAEVGGPVNDNASENHGKAVSTEAKTESTNNIQLKVPTLNINLGLGL